MSLTIDERNYIDGRITEARRELREDFKEDIKDVNNKLAQILDKTIKNSEAFGLIKQDFSIISRVFYVATIFFIIPGMIALIKILFDRISG